MAKINNEKRRIYTVGTMASVACIDIRGKFLESDFALGIGARIASVVGCNMLVFNFLKVGNEKPKGSHAYTIRELAGVPSLHIKGKFLETEFGLSVGDKVELIAKGNTIILRKLTAIEVAQIMVAKDLRRAKKEVCACRKEVNYFGGLLTDENQKTITIRDEDTDILIAKSRGEIGAMHQYAMGSLNVATHKVVVCESRVQYFA